jgi:[ribosomal protein S5]-alanine N-acetyltransferase
MSGENCVDHIYFETEHFRIRQWSLGDVDDLWKIMSDHRVHTYTSDSAWSKERTESYIKFMIEKDCQTLEVFHAACILKQSNELIGLSGLNPYLAQQPELEWQFGVPFWGKGYATEIGKAVIENAFLTTNIVSIFGMADLANKASCRALEKIGMKCLGLQDFRGHQDMFYRIDKES